MDHSLQISSNFGSLSPSIGQKICDLFSCRRIGESLSFHGIVGIERQWLLTNLVHLQSSIYSLDCYGESIWDARVDVVEDLWGSIHKRLRAFGFTYHEIEFLIADMRAYQDIEAQLRDGISPSKMNIKTFYDLKTCDVRLSRRIIEMVERGSCSSRANTLWECYDLSCEIVDDLSDFWEDLSNFNCNRFLISLRDRGYAETRAEYLHFLERIITRTREISTVGEESGLSEVNQIGCWILESVRNARVVLDQLGDDMGKKSCQDETSFVRPVTL